MASDDDAEIVQAFLDESRENLDQLDRDLIGLEACPTDQALLAQVFRTIHTVKGTCGFLGYRNLEALSHAGENLLGALRSGDVLLDVSITTTLLRLVDATREALDRIETIGTEGDSGHASIIDALAAHVTPASEGGRADAGEPVPTAAPGVAAETSVRVDVAVLDKLMDLVGELVQARNQIGEALADDDEGPLAITYRQLRLATGELQEGVMRARLQPVGTVTGKFRRVVRDLSLALGKQVRIEIDGEDVGVDKAVNEAIAGPLLHLVRNAVDHGIEPPGERISAGKPAEGLLRIRAFHEGGRVHVEVSDDGRGIDQGRLVEKAVATGMLSADRAQELSAREVFELMFRPGLSTKGDVTSVSGRGVGLDVVRSSLEQVGGTVEVTSDPGRGCSFLLSVPLTLAIMPAVLTWCGGERYTIPQVDVEEVLHLDAAEAAAEIHRIEGVGLHRLRGRLLPLVDLSEQLGGAPVSAEAGLTIVVVAPAGGRFGLVVDSVGDMTEAVVKPLPRATSAVPAFVGVTILGDGRPSLILDVAGVAELAGIVPGPVSADGRGADGHGDGIDSGDDADGVAGLESADAHSLLVVTASYGGRMAVRLGSVRRLEQFDAGSVERCGFTDVVQYRDAILPLLQCGPRLQDGPRAQGVPAAPSGRIRTVVCDSSIGLVGLVVQGIEDILPEHATPRGTQNGRGGFGSLVLENLVTDLVDVEGLIADAGLSHP